MTAADLREKRRKENLNTRPTGMLKENEGRSASELREIARKERFSASNTAETRWKAQQDRLRAQREEERKLQQSSAQQSLAQQYAQSRTAGITDRDAHVRANYAARREWEKDTDALIEAKNMANNQTVTGPIGAGDNPWAEIARQSNKSQKTTNYISAAEEYRKKYGIQSDEELNNTLRKRESDVAQREAFHKEVEKREPYRKYNRLTDEDKALVRQAYGKTEYEPTISDNASGQLANNIISKSNARNEAKNQLKEKYGFTDDDLKELKQGYKDSKKYGTPITENQDLKAKYDSLDGRGRQLVRDAYKNADKQEKIDPYAAMWADIYGNDKPEEVRDTHAREILRSEYGLTDDDITQLSIYASRYEDARMGNAEFAENIGKEAARDLTGVASIASIGGNVIGAVTSPIGIAKDLAENAALRKAGYTGDLTLNKDNPWYIPKRVTSAIREQRGEDLDTYWNDKLGTDNHVASFVYQTAMSGADSLVAARIGSLFPTVDFGGTLNGAKNIMSVGKGVKDAAYSLSAGGLMLGAGAGVDTMLDLADKGASAQTAVAGGLVSGTFEMLFEDLSISQLDTFKGIEALEMAKGFSRDAVKQNVKIAAKKLLGTAVTNASEEGLTEIANLVYDTLANGDMSQYAEYYNNAIADGKSTDDARKQAFKEMALQVLEAAAGGALMGVGFGVGGVAKLNAQRNTTYALSPDGLVKVTPKNVGRDISAASREKEVLNAAEVVGGTAKELKDQYTAKNKGLTSKQLGKIAMETNFAAEGDEKKTEALKSFREEAKLKRETYKQVFNKEARFEVTNAAIKIDGKDTHIVNKNANKDNTVADIFRKGRNGLEFETADGRTVKLDKKSVTSIQNADARELAKSVLDNNLGSESANLLFDTYDGEYTPGDHARSFMRLYRQGALGTSAKNIVSLYGDDRSKFTADKTQEILNLGLKEKPLIVGSTDWTTGNVSWFEKQQISIIDSVVKSLAKKNPSRTKEVIVVDDLMESYTDSEGKERLRFFNGTAVGKNRILLSVKANQGLLLSFFAHEMGHQMKLENRAKYDELAEFVKSRYKGDEYQKTLDEFVRKGYDPEEAEEELICNSLFEVFDQKTVKQIVGKDYKFAYKMLDIASALVQEYDKRLDQFANKTRDGVALHSDIKKLRKDRDMVEGIRKRFLEFVNSKPGESEENNGDEIKRSYSDVSTDIWKHKDLQYAALKNTNSKHFSDSNSILSFDEAIADAKEFPYDFTREQAYRAEDEGKLIIYSTEPIENGVFIYTSREDAEAYSNDGNVYEKVVSPLDVAWDNIEGGVYAEVESGLDNFILEKLLKISYNEYDKERDKWEAKGKVPKGTRRFMYNPYNGKFEVWERGDDALLKLVEDDSFKEAMLKYAKIDRRRRSRLFRTFGWIGYSKGQEAANLSLYGGQGDNGRGNSRIEEAERTANSKGSGAANTGRDNEATLQGRIEYKRPAKNGGALSDAPKFSISDDIEETRNLVAVHNTDENRFMAALKLGGLPMPSIAIIKADMGHNDFGDISLVFGKSTIDPEASRANKVYGRDAYTPTRVKVDYNLSEDVLRKASKRITEIIKSSPYKDVSQLRGSYVNALDLDNATRAYEGNEANLYDAFGGELAMQTAYAAEKGIDLSSAIKEGNLDGFYELTNDQIKYVANALGEEKVDEYNKGNLGDKGVKEITDLLNKHFGEKLYDADDYHSARAAIDGAVKYFNNGIPQSFDRREVDKIFREIVSKDDYTEWLTNLLQGIEKGKGIRNNADMFTPSGNRRSWSALHWEYTLENIVRAMKSQEQQKGKAMFGSNITGAAAEEFSSIADIKSASSKLFKMDQEEFFDTQRKYLDRFNEITENFKSAGNSVDSWLAQDSAKELLCEAVIKYGINEKSIANYLRREGQGWANINMADTVSEELVELVKDIRAMPTGYFEAKPQRAVGLGEIRAVIVPSDVSPRLKTWLKNRGIENIVEYESGNEKDRLEKLNSLEDVKFSMRDQEYYDVNAQIDQLRSERQIISDKLDKYRTSSDYRRLLADMDEPGIDFDSLVERAKSLEEKHGISGSQSRLDQIDAQIKRLTQKVKDVAREIHSDADIEKAAIKWGAKKEENGKPSEYYHGTNADFFIFDASHFGETGTNYGVGYYLTGDIFEANRYGGRIIKAYVKDGKWLSPSTRIADIDEQQLRDFLKRVENDISGNNPKYIDKNAPWRGNSFDAEQELKGFVPDGRVYKEIQQLVNSAAGGNGEVAQAILNHFVDATGYVGLESKEDGIVVMYKNSDIKSSDNVTTDENGNIIPLSKRFNSENDEYRYSISDRTEETEFDDYIDSASDEEIKSLVDEVDARMENRPYASDTEEQREIYAILDEMKRARDALLSGTDGEIPDDDEFWESRTAPKNTIDGTRVLNKGQKQKVKKESVYQIVRKYKRDYSAKGIPLSLENTDKITEMLSELYDTVLNGEDVAWDEVYEKARDIALETVKYTNYYTDSHWAGAGKSRKLIKQRLRRENPYGYYRETQRAVIDENGRRVWSEADLDGNPVNDKYAAFGETFEPYDDETQRGLAHKTITDLANEIVSDIFDAPISNSQAVKDASTKAKYENRIKELKLQIEQLRSDAKRETNQKVKAQHQKDVEYYHRRMKEIREDRDQKLIALKMLQRQKEIERREFSQRRDLKSKIIRKYDRLQKMTTNPTEKQHVPAELMHAIAGFLGDITPNMLQDETRKDGTVIKKRAKNNTRLIDLVAAYKAIQNDYEDVYDPEVANLLDEASTAFGSKYLDEMDSNELADVNRLMGAIEHTVRYANKAFVEGKERDAFALAKNLIRQSEEGKKSRFNRAKQIVWSQLNPYSFFHAMSNYEDGGWMDIYKILNEGQLRKTRIQTDVVDAFKEFMINAELDKLSDYKNGLVDVGLVGVDNQPIKITRGLMLSLYLHLQNEQNRKHIAEGGLTLPNFEAYYKNKINAWGNETVRTLAINGDLFRLHAEQNRLRELKRNSDSDEIRARYDEDIAELESQMEELRGDADRLMDDISLRIESELTDYERKFIDKAKWFFNEYSKEKLNEATMRMYGFKKAREENYMPIISDPDFLKTEFKTVTRDASLENMGFMKDRQKGANNAIKLLDLTDVINAQLNKVSKFAGLAPSIKEFNRVYNKSLFNDKGGKTSAKEAAKQRFDTFGEDYIENLLADLQGGRKAKGSTNIFSALRGANYQAALMLNLRVAMAQAGSYPTAAAEVGWKPLMKALAKGGKDGKVISRADRELIDKYTPLLANRFVGGASTDITNIKSTNKHTIGNLERRALQHTRAMTDWISMVDTATVGRLWSAAEYYVDENFDLEKGSEGEIKSGESEYYKKVAEVFNRIVERTQPSYTTMQRSELLRNPNEALKFFTMFMTQRAQNFNLVYDAAATFARENEKRKSGVYDAAKYEEARRTLTRTALSQAIAGVTLAVMKGVADAIQHNMKGYKDDDDELTIMSILERVFKTFIESEISNMAGGSELFSFVDSLVTGSTYYGITANPIESVNTMITTVNSMIKNGVTGKKLINLGNNVGMVAGIPASQMKKWVEMFKGWAEDIMDGGEIYSNVTGSSSVKNTTEKMVKKYLNGDMDDYRKIRESLKGENASTVKTNITSYLREQYVDGKLDDAEVRRVLSHVYGMSDSNINKKLEEFKQRKNGTYQTKESKKWGEE